MGTSQQNPDELEYCSECCNFVESLNEITGWCDGCTRKNGYGTFITPLCPVCDNPSVDGKLCSRCKYEKWLERNADKIELIMAVQIVSVRVAKKIVAEQNRPLCRSCNQPIKGGTKGRHYFCTTRPECVKASHVYEYHLRTKPQSEALTLAITASVIYKLTANIYNRVR